MNPVYSPKPRWHICRNVISLLVVAMACGVAAHTLHADDNHDTLTQISIFSALLNGDYAGSTTCAELLTHGNIGLGTFDALDGEMIVLDGKVYRVKSNGCAEPAAANETTPFACVTPFEADLTLPVSTKMTMDDIQKLIVSKLPSSNLFYAIRIDGTFRAMKTRSVPRQAKPYPPLLEVVKSQPTFELQNVKGTIVGLWSPAYVKSLGVPGFHLHFITADRTAGGHILSFVMTDGTIQVDTTTGLNVQLPGSAAFLNSDLSGDRSRDTHAVEKEPGK